MSSSVVSTVKQKVVNQKKEALVLYDHDGGAEGKGNDAIRRKQGGINQHG